MNFQTELNQMKERDLTVILREDFTKTFPKKIVSDLVVEYWKMKHEGYNHYQIIGNLARKYMPNNAR